MGGMYARCVLLSGVLLALQVGVMTVHAAPTNLGIAWGDVNFLSTQPLPRAAAVNILKNTMNIRNIRLYEDITLDSSALQAILDATIGSTWQPKVVITVPSIKIPDLANGGYAASFMQVLTRYSSIVAAVAVSNEPDTCCNNGSRCCAGCCALQDTAAFLDLTKKAVENMVQALASNPQTKQIMVTVPFSQNVLAGCFPPSACTVKPELAAGTTSILQAIKGQGSGAYVMANVYPPFAWQYSNPLYVLGIPGAPTVVDGAFTYSNMFDAQYDSVRVGFNKLGDFSGLPIVVGETGWPTAGGPIYANLTNACIYNNYLIRYLKNGKYPPRESSAVTVFMFEAFDEYNKPGDVEKYWGIYKENGDAKYSVDWEGTRIGPPDCTVLSSELPPGDLTVNMYVNPAAPQPGETFTYTIKVTATATAAVSSANGDDAVSVSHIYLPVISDPSGTEEDGPKNVRLVDTLPGGLTLLFVSPYSACRYKDFSRTVSCKWPMIGQGSFQLVRITVLASSAGKYDNTVTVFADSVPDGVSSSTGELAVCVPAGSSCKPSRSGASDPCCSGKCTRLSWSATCRTGRTCYRPYVCQ